MAWTWISGGTMSGYCEMGRFSIETMPMTTVRMAITIATMGRRMKKLDIAYLPAPPEAAEDAGIDVWCGLTGTPSFSFWILLRMMRSPDLRPDVTTQFGPYCGPRVTFTMCTLSSGPTV